MNILPLILLVGAAEAAVLGADRDRPPRGAAEAAVLTGTGRREWGGQSTLFVTLIDPSQHFTFFHLIDQSTSQSQN